MRPAPGGTVGIDVARNPAIVRATPGSGNHRPGLTRGQGRCCWIWAAMDRISDSCPGRAAICTAIGVPEWGCRPAGTLAAGHRKTFHCAEYGAKCMSV